MDDQLEIARLITGYIQKTLTADERTRLEKLCQSDARIRHLVEKYRNADVVETSLQHMQMHDADHAWQRLLERKYHSGRSTRRVSWRAIGSIVMILIVGSVVLWRYMGRSSHQSSEQFAMTHKISPGSSRAQLLLSTGKTIELNNRQQQIHEVNGALVQNKAGELVYSGQSQGHQMAYNTLLVPRGGTYNLTLSDGTKVWLNASSSLRFPVNFDSDERVVQLTGEAYFEVSKDENRPFKVAVHGRSIRVLGTSFNVNAYRPEANITTLISGAVEVDDGIHRHVLNPGQQALMQDNKITVAKADLGKAIAWKEGYFLFNGDPVNEALEQVARWYDVDLEYQGELPHFHIGGSIKRDEQLRDALDMLQDVSGLHFQIIGKKIRIHE